MGSKFGFSFSWKRATGISSTKGKISRAIGVPLTKQGRQRKFGQTLGCATLITFVGILLLSGCQNVSTKQPQVAISTQEQSQQVGESLSKPELIITQESIKQAEVPVTNTSEIAESKVSENQTATESSIQLINKNAISLASNEEETKTAPSSFIIINNGSGSLVRSSNNAIYIFGETSPNCWKITVEAVNITADIYDPPYQLITYKKGDTSFKYGVREDWNNLGEGKNQYTFKAYCDIGQTKTATYVITNVPAKPIFENTSNVTPAYTAPVLSNDNYYTNTDGQQVHSPAYSNTIPSGASARCSDGTYSFSQHRSGTCSGHGGVATWL